MSRSGDMDRNEELIQSGVDEALTSDELAQLKTLLESSEDARALDAQMRGLSQLLGDLPTEPLPPGLGETLRRTASRYARRPAVRRRTEGWRGALVALRYVGAFAAGLLLTAVLYEMGTPPGRSGEMTGLAGSMIQGQALTISEPLDGFSLATEVLTGRVDLRRGDSLLVVQFELDSSAPVEVLLDYAGEGLVFGGFAQEENELAEVEVASGRVRLLSDGRHRFAVFLRGAQGAAARMGLRFSADGAVLHEQALSAGR